ncbi:MAG: hypothetical protein ACR2M0_10970 [Chloroflexia bacterium]
MSKRYKQPPVVEPMTTQHSINAIGVLPESDGLDSLYTFRDYVDVERFLAEYAFLVPLLEEMYSPLRKRFPEEPLSLSIFADPEVVGDVELVLLIAPTCPPDEAADRFDGFMEDWWLDNVDRAEDKLAVVVEYQ